MENVFSIKYPDHSMGEQENKSINLARILWHNRMLILSSMILCGIIAYIISLFIPKMYEAKATLLIMPSKYQSDVKPTAFSTPTYQGLLDSREITKEIIDQLGLKDMTVESLQKAMSTKTIMESLPKSLYTPVIDLIVQSDNPQTTAAIANKWAEIFVNRTKFLGSQEIDKTYLLLTTQLDSTERNLIRAESAIRRLRIAYKLTDLQSERTSILQQLNGTASGIPAQQNYSQFMTSNLMSLALLPTSEINQQQGYRGMYTSLIFALSTVENHLKQPESKISSDEKRRLQDYADSLNTQINELSKTINQLEKKANKLSETIAVGETELYKLQQDVDNYKRNYSLIFDKAEQAKISKAEQVEDIKIFAKAVVPEQPIWPRKSIIAIVAGLVGLFISAGFVLTKEYINTIPN